VADVISVRSQRPVTPVAGAGCTSRHSVVYKMAKIIFLHVSKFISNLTPYDIQKSLEEKLTHVNNFKFYL
jgi:hypothetical protein